MTNLIQATRQDLNLNLIGYGSIIINGVSKLVNLHSDTATFGDCEADTTTLLYKDDNGNWFKLESNEFNNLTDFYTI